MGDDWMTHTSGTERLQERRCFLWNSYNLSQRCHGVVIVTTVLCFQKIHNRDCRKKVPIVMLRENCTGPGNDGFLYYAIYCTHYTGTGNHCFLLGPLFSIVAFPVPVPVPVRCSVYEPLEFDYNLPGLTSCFNYFSSLKNESLKETIQSLDESMGRALPSQSIFFIFTHLSGKF